MTEKDVRRWLPSDDKATDGDHWDPYSGVSKNSGTVLYPKMDGENNGKPYIEWMNLGVPLFLETPL